MGVAMGQGGSRCSTRESNREAEHGWKGRVVQETCSIFLLLLFGLFLYTGLIIGMEERIQGSTHTGWLGSVPERQTGTA